MRISDWSSDVCSSDLHRGAAADPRRFHRAALRGRSARMSLFASVIALTLAGTPPAADYRQRQPEDAIVHFLLPDRFHHDDAGNDRDGLQDNRLAPGYHAPPKGFFQEKQTVQ